MVKILSLLAVTGFSAASFATALNLNDIKWPPYFFPRLEQATPGLAKEILDICITKQGYDINYKSLPIKRTHVYMLSGELDISVYSHKPEREKFVAYGKEPLFTSEYGFASRADDKVEINSLRDLYKYRFGNLAGLSHTPELASIIEDKRANGQVNDGYDIDAMFGQLLATPQRFEVMANSTATFYWRAEQLGISDKVKIHDFVVAVKPYYLTISRSSPNIDNIQQFLDKFDQCLLDLKSSGQYQQILGKYGFTSPKNPE
ncbi:substrate-binding periplasmic protein [Thalassotalea euphylliae]|uniref:substrate-binding periplasmic protein n=1 Tax=Thalassotalea euphylliae TaxID=1655234 RepID=UPI003636ABC5